MKYVDSSIELENVVKSFTIKISDPNSKTILNKFPTKTISNTILNGITLTIKKGEVVGIIGRNGSGKSTLLSIIAGIMEPTSGAVQTSGKIASILELGMGFHPDMSGRDNIYLKGELYGFSHKQMSNRIENIIKYSGIGKYIDNPVRTYSSGMMGRLAFAIMVNVDSEIILVDEILSVGDISFKNKAKQHFRKIARSGKTVIFVSHSLEDIESMCNRTIWIEGGNIYKDGPSKQICSEYQNAISESLDVITDLAEEGVSDAQYKLALMYRDGHGLEKNTDQYRELIKQAADQGHVKAQVEFADILVTEKDYDNATIYYQSAANKGNNDAKIKIASINNTDDLTKKQTIETLFNLSKNNDKVIKFKYGEILLKTAWNTDDRTKAFNAFAESAKQNYPAALYQLGLMYKDGVGTTRNVKKMEEYLKKASEYGHVPSITMLADIYSQGTILPKDEESSFKLNLIASELGNVNAMYKTAMAYKEGYGTDADQTKADEWFKKYIHAGISTLILLAGDRLKTEEAPNYDEIVTMYTSVSDTNNASAIWNLIQYCVANKICADDHIKHLKEMGEKGNLDAIKKIANIHYNGVGIEKNYNESLNWYKKALSLGDSSVSVKIGEMYRDGIGTPIDPVKATECFMYGAKNGNVIAIWNIISMYVSGMIEDSNVHINAMNMLKKLAKCGNSDAARRLGNLYYDGVGVKKDYSEAIVWYEIAANLGDQWSKTRLGDMYRDGRGTIQNLKKSVEFYLS